MILKKEIYPKTPRLSCNGEKIHVTEKLDGSNLCIFKKDDKVYFAQRKRIYDLDEVKALDDKERSNLYKGLYQWLIDNESVLRDIHEGSVLCGEWLGMGCLKYSVDEFDKRFYMFAKARITDDFTLTNRQFDHEQFHWCFDSQELPSCIGIVPEVCELNVLPNKEHLDSVYNKYCEKVKRNVEGFVIEYKNTITKYVRMKNGVLQEHFDREEKDNE